MPKLRYQVFGIKVLQKRKLISINCKQCQQTMQHILSITEVITIIALCKGIFIKTNSDSTNLTGLFCITEQSLFTFSKRNVTLSEHCCKLEQILGSIIPNIRQHWIFPQPKTYKMYSVKISLTALLDQSKNIEIYCHVTLSAVKSIFNIN